MNKIIFVGPLLMTLGLGSCDGNKKSAEACDTTNEVIDNIMTRRSIRKYTNEQVPMEKLDTILKCAIYAPSALNRQSWEIRVVTNTEILNDINGRFVDFAKGRNLPGSASRAAEPGFSVFHSAPVLIIVGKDKSNSYSATDCGLMAQNILLSAHTLGLATCVIGSVSPILNNAPDILKRIEMPETHEVSFGIALGYPNEQPEAPARDNGKVKIID